MSWRRHERGDRLAHEWIQTRRWRRDRTATQKSALMYSPDVLMSALRCR